MAVPKFVSASLPLSLALAAASADAANYDESKVPFYTLPDPLRCEDGRLVTEAGSWRTERRGEILELFRSQMHGRSPEDDAGMTWEVLSEDRAALAGLATRREVAIRFDGADAPVFHLLLYVPNAATKPVPTFLGVNFDGNHTISADPGITIHPRWVWDRKAGAETLEVPGDDDRGKGAGRWQLGTVLSRGHGLATIPRADVEPDYATGWQHGIRGHLLKQAERTKFAPDDWGAIGAWAWGLSRALDVLEHIPDVDAKRIAVMGHSHMGKTALWAGAQDERFALVISNNSGEGGAALARRLYGETTAVMNRNFPHWFCANFKQYTDKEDTLPFDQHELLALSAPRPLYVASAQEDRWADPRGEFLSALAADPVYRLLGVEGLGTDAMPEVNQPAGITVRYHIRTGKHNVTEFDWEQYLAFADRYLR